MAGSSNRSSAGRWGIEVMRDGVGVGVKEKRWRTRQEERMRSEVGEGGGGEDAVVKIGRRRESGRFGESGE
jgi:type IV pilus biogenesis protein CpaD/CtpE